LFGDVHMRRALITVLLLLLVAAAPAYAAGPAAPTTDKPTLSAELTACASGPTPAERAVEFTGSMPALSGTKRMQMRFTLLQRRGLRGAFKKVAVPGWSDWEKSDPYRPGFIFTKRVEGLLAPAAYRATIAFRWYDKRGKLQRSSSRTTAICMQQDPRPDLVLASFGATAASDDQATYAIGVIDNGASPAGAFTVGLRLGTTQLGPLAAAALDPGQTTTVTITGPRCESGSTVEIDLDAGDAVDEADEANDVLQRPCPL
jgi:hypothetical protein